MSDDQEYRLTIDAFTPQTLPMARLAEYMAELARLLGEQANVHFSHLERGSAVLVSTVEDVAKPKVEEQLEQVRRGDATKEAAQAYRAIDALLAKDNAIARLTRGTADVIAFPGRTRQEPLRYGPLREDGFLDGVVIRIGGRDSTIPVWIQGADGTEHVCQATLELSKKLAVLYRGATVRVFGRGKWVREESGIWSLLQFDIDRYEVLDEASLAEVVSTLRAIEGSEWDKDGRFGDVLALRREEGPAH